LVRVKYVVVPLDLRELPKVWKARFRKTEKLEKLAEAIVGGLLKTALDLGIDARLVDLGIQPGFVGVIELPSFGAIVVVRVTPEGYIVSAHGVEFRELIRAIVRFLDDTYRSVNRKQGTKRMIGGYWDDNQIT